MEDSNEESDTPYQDILNEIVRELISAKKYIWGEDFGLDPHLCSEEKNLLIENRIG
jgi:hypothetical protein